MLDEFAYRRLVRSVEKLERSAARLTEAVRRLESAFRPPPSPRPTLAVVADNEEAEDA